MMSATISTSLFDPQPTSVLPSAADWVTGVILGSVGTSLCVIGIAIVGLMLMNGRLAVRKGLRVVAGCFILLGASTIANGLRELAYTVTPEAVPLEITVTPTRPPPPPANYDPYGRASVRRN